MSGDVSEILRRNASVLQRSIDGETVLYLPATDDVIVLDDIGSVVWDELDEPSTQADLAARLADRFDQPVDRVAADIDPLLAQLSAGGWLAS